MTSRHGNWKNPHYQYHYSRTMYWLLVCFAALILAVAFEILR